MADISVIIPVFNEAPNIARLEGELRAVLHGRDMEVIFVDDGSTDDSPERWSREPWQRVVEIPRSGKSRALQAGLAAATGDKVVMLDGDLQDDPVEMVKLIGELDRGADLVCGVRQARVDGYWRKRLPSAVFNALISLLFLRRFRDINCGFRAGTRQCLQALPWFDGAHRFLPLLAHQRGFCVREVPVLHRPRHAGRPKFDSPGRFFGALGQLALLRLGWRPAVAGAGRTDGGCAALAVFLAWLALSVGMILPARDLWPIPKLDAIAFMPSMVEYARTGELMNRISPTAQLWDPAGGGRHIGHGFLYQLVVGSLAPAATYPAVYSTMAWLNAVALGFWSLVFWRCLRGSGPRFDWWHVAAVVTAQAGCCTMLVGLLGRPEPFAVLLLGLTIWAMGAVGGRFNWMVAGIGIGLLGATHPIAGFVSGLGFALDAAIRSKLRKAMATIAAAGVLAFAVFLLTFRFYPYPLADWLGGILRHADAAILSPATVTPWAGLFVSRFSFYELVWTMTLVLAAMAIRRGWSGWGSRWLAAGLLLLLAASVYYFALRSGFTIYNLQLFAPAAFVFVLRQSALTRFSTNNPRLVAAVVAMAFLLTSAGFFRNLALWGRARNLGQSYWQARADLQDFRARNPDGILLSHPLFLLTEDYRGMRSRDYTPDLSLRSHERWLLVTSEADVDLAGRAGFELWRRGPDLGPVRVAGVDLRGKIPGYGFFIFKRVAPSAAPVERLVSTKEP